MGGEGGGRVAAQQRGSAALALARSHLSTGSPRLTNRLSHLSFTSMKTCATPTLPAFDEAGGTAVAADDGGACGSDSAPAPEPRASASGAASAASAASAAKSLCCR